MNRFILGFLPRCRSPAAFFFVAACYILAWKAVAPMLVALLGLWPTTMDAVEHVMKPVRLGLGANAGFASRSLLARAAIALLFTPVVESLVVISIIEVLRRLRCTAFTQVICSALAFSSLHSLAYPIWGLLVAPSFLIGAASYVYWRRSSVGLAAMTMMGLHFVSNVMPVLGEVARRTQR